MSRNDILFLARFLRAMFDNVLVYSANIDYDYIYVAFMDTDDTRRYNKYLKFNDIIYDVLYWRQS